MPAAVQPVRQACGLLSARTQLQLRTWGLLASAAAGLTRLALSSCLPSACCPPARAVPFEQVHSHVINLPIREMDCWIAG